MGSEMCIRDRINRTSAKTQSALLEVMEEGQATVDGVAHLLPRPYTVIATQNPVGSAGTQLLPESQLDRFMIRISIGYPALENEVRILKQARGARAVDSVRPVVSLNEVTALQEEVESVHVAEELFVYIARLVAATREHPLIRLGASPRAGTALLRISRASAWMNGRDYLIPADVRALFHNVLEHRIVPEPQVKLDGLSVTDLLAEVLQSVPAPKP